MTTKKNFNDSLTESIAILTEGKIAEPDYLTPEEKKTAKEKKEMPEQKKILLRMDLNTYNALRKKMYTIAAEEGRSCNLTEFINGILEKYLQEI